MPQDNRFEDIPIRMTAPIADMAAMARTGASVRARLAADPTVYRVPAEKAELYAVTGFLDPTECDHLIGLIDRVAKPSRVYDPETQARVRTSYSGDVDRNDSFVRMVERRICDLMGIDESWGETLQGQRYLPGQEYQAHFDWFDTSAPYWPEETRRGGQRCWTAMIFLNDVEEGGQTEFTNLGIAIPPQRGVLLAWNNATVEGVPNSYTKHAATPVIRGVKHVVTKWFRTRRWG